MWKAIFAVSVGASLGALLRGIGTVLWLRSLRA